MRDMLAAMLVKSGNDAATAIAMHVGGTEEQFVEHDERRRPRELGLKDTHFANPHGLDARGPVLDRRRSVDAGSLRDVEAGVSATSWRMKKVTVGKKGGRRHKLESTDLLLGNYRGAVGVKTGNTDSAGYSVVSAAQRGGVMLYAVVLARRRTRSGSATPRSCSTGASRTTVRRASRPRARSWGRRR